ncbi:hypothetical protein TELCIR_08197 [Teladorsagia circumcincta]|uniref:Uncharacterized protein n=1 Tax=Teladorsagia circumcincta TaxID=45464 RepID=A0A2G9UI99_TELCI|nr:hypothetical protein TELCIR_08197 [Teladorsagia circumcincta]
MLSETLSRMSDLPLSMTMEDVHMKNDHDQHIGAVVMSTHLLHAVEVFFSMVLLIQAPDLLTMDGTYFYFLGLFDGGGGTLFALHVITLMILGFSGKMLVPSSVVLTAMLSIPGSPTDIGSDFNAAYQVTHIGCVGCTERRKAGQAGKIVEYFWLREYFCPKYFAYSKRAQQIKIDECYHK